MMDRKGDNGFTRTNSTNQDTIQEMEQIQRGLEAFLEQELQSMQERSATEGEMAEDRSEGHMKSRRRASEEEYFEDWDSPERVSKTEKKQRIVKDIPSNDVEDKVSSKEAGRKKDKKVNEKKQDVASSKKRGRKKKSKFKGFLITVIILLALLAAGLYLLVGNVYSKMNYVPIENLEAEPMEEEDVVNILLIGSDARGG